MTEKKKSILVTGDFVMDHHIYEGKRIDFGDRRNRGVHAIEELGGAALIYYLLQELKGGAESYVSMEMLWIKKEQSEEEEEQSKGNNKPKAQEQEQEQGQEQEKEQEDEYEETRLPNLPPNEEVPNHLKAYAVWKPLGPKGVTSSEKLMWLTDDAMGFGSLSEKEERFDWPSVIPPEDPRVVVISDGGLGVRDEKGDFFPADIGSSADGKEGDSGPRWYVLKTTHPFAEGKLWESLNTPEMQSKLVIVVSSEDIRKADAYISKGLSWDSTVQSVLKALAPGGGLEQLTRCRHLVIAFGTEGGLWLDMDGPREKWNAHLVYDADAVEGEHRRPGKGTAFGALSCLTAAVAWHLACEKEESDQEEAPDLEAAADQEEAPDLEAALEGGLSAIFDLFEKGHGPTTMKGAGYPAERLANVIKDATCRFARTVFSVDSVGKQYKCDIETTSKKEDYCWSLVHQALRQQGKKCPDPAWDLAELVARRGPIALGSLPHLSIGDLMSVDRTEIVDLRILRRLICDYRDRDAKQCKKPLSIGIFGPPGSGKSFAVKQIATTLMGKEGWLEFNLAQFKEGTDDLIGAFHQIRDRALRGQTPVAFFDEFDSRDYEWLQYLLAPMQDGAFQEGQITHPIGKCIFIYAGGTGETFETFGPHKSKHDEYMKFKMAKGPDFKSRLDGILDLLGPNQRMILTDEEGRPLKEPFKDTCDIFYPVRRAFIMRGELDCRPSDRLDIDPGILQALLRVEDYYHGARSLSKILEPLKPALPGKIYQSLRAPHQQLKLHVDPKKFLEECSKAEEPAKTPGLGGRTREVMAEAIHETWRKLGKQQGWLDDKNDLDYDAISPFYKDSNLAAADRMPENLALIGLHLDIGTISRAERENVRLEIEHNLEMLAEAEHAGWMDWHLDQGWEYGPKGAPDYSKDPKPNERKHPCLLPYLDLSDVERNKDRTTIRHYLDFAKKAKMVICPL